MISATDKACLVLLRNSDLYKVCPKSCTKIKLNFIAIEENPTSNRLRSNCIFPDDDHENFIGIASSKPSTELVTDIICCETFSVALTSRNCLYTIPSKVHQFPKHERVAKMCGGAEHVLVLTQNGDVYGFGSSS